MACSFKDTEMAGHRYAVGDRVEMRRSTHQIDLGPYTITRLLPNDSADREYRVKHERGGQERVVAESGITASTMPAPVRLFR
jgi:hypothetical protein